MGDNRSFFVNLKRPFWGLYFKSTNLWKNNLSISKKLYLKTSFEVNSSCVGCLLQTNVNIWEAKLIGGACIIVTATTTTATADFCRIVVVDVQQQVGRNSIYRLRSKRDIIRLRSINSWFLIEIKLDCRDWLLKYLLQIAFFLLMLHFDKS